LIERLTPEILAWQLCPRLTVGQIVRCRGSSTASWSLFSNDELWARLCVRSRISLPDKAVSRIWSYYKSVSHSACWSQQLQSALRQARMTSSNPNDSGPLVTASGPHMKSYTLEGHTCEITCISLDAAADRLCTADVDGKLCMWSCNGRLLGKTGLKNHAVLHLEMWSDWLVAADSSHRLHVFHLSQKGNGGSFTQLQVVRAAPAILLEASLTSAVILKLKSDCDSLVIELCSQGSMWTIAVSGGQSTLSPCEFQIANPVAEDDSVAEPQWIEWLRSATVELPVACVAGKIHFWDSEQRLVPLDQPGISELQLNALQTASQSRCLAAGGSQLVIKCTTGDQIAVLSCGRGPRFSVQLVECLEMLDEQLLGFDASVGWIGWYPGNLSLWGTHGASIQVLEGLTKPLVYMAPKHTVVADGLKAVVCVALARDQVNELTPTTPQKSKKQRKPKGGIKALKDR